LKRILTILLIFCAAQGYSQKLSPSEFNFGKVKLWNNPTATFTFTNTSSKKLIFLPIAYQRNLYIDLPSGYIEPGESRTIKAIYYTEDGGNVNVNQPLYHSAGGDPIMLRLKGKILSFHPDAFTVCPSVDNKNPQQIVTPGMLTVTVYDKNTGLAINGVDFLLEGGQKRFLMENSRKAMVPIEGLPYGYYNLNISKTGYYEHKGSLYVGKHSGAITYYLKPIPKIIAQIEPEKEVEPSDGFVELEPKKDDEMADIERIRKMTDEQFKGRDIRERDVLVVRENEKEDSVEIIPEKKEESIVEISDVPDLDEGGSLSREKYALNNVVLLIDVSGSMKINEKLDNLKVSIKRLASVMRPEDRLTIITYSSRSTVVLASCPGDQKDKIYSVIDSLKAKGNSFGAQGMFTAYQFAQENFIQGGNNEIILATDGLFNSREISEKDLYEKAAFEYGQGVSMSVVGFGKKKEARKFMQTIAKNGGGNFIEINSAQDANSALLKEIMTKARIVGQ